MHCQCMSRSITIRNVPDETGRELAARAATSGRSLQEYLRNHLIDLASRPSPETWVAKARERLERTGSRVGAEVILDEIEAGRR